MKSVVMVGGGLQQVEAVNQAKKLGFFVIVTDKNQGAPCFEGADLSLVIDGNDIAELVKFIRKNKKKYNICGIFTCVNLASSVASVANKCGLLGVAPEAARSGDNKLQQKKILFENKIPTPNYFIASSYKEALAVCKKLGWRVVIKPQDSFGGQGVKIIRSEKELKKGLDEIKKYSKENHVIFEELVEGHFVDLEGLFYREKFYPIAIVDSHFLWEYPKGNFISPIEYKNVYPASVENVMQRELFSITKRAALALGINFGPVATDMVITKKGPMLIEISARLHGSSSNLFLIPQASGIKPVTLLIKIMTGGSLSKSDTLPKFNGFGIHKYLLCKEGRIISISGLEEAKKNSDLKKIFLFKNIGDKIYYRNSTDVAAGITVVSKTRKEAERTVKQAESLIEFNVR